MSAAMDVDSKAEAGTSASPACADGFKPVPCAPGVAGRTHPTPRTRIYYNPELSQFSLGEDHPMVPNRLHLTHRLAELWGLFEDPNVTIVREYAPATTAQLRRFHTDEYIAFLEYLDTLDLTSMTPEEQQEKLGDDLAMFGLSVCRPPGSGGSGSDDEEAKDAAEAAAKDAAGPVKEEGKDGATTGPVEPGAAAAAAAAKAEAAAAVQRQREAEKEKERERQRVRQEKAQAAKLAKAEERAMEGRVVSWAEAAAVLSSGEIPKFALPANFLDLGRTIARKVLGLAPDEALTPAQEEALADKLRRHIAQALQRNPNMLTGGPSATAAASNNGSAATAGSQARSLGGAFAGRQMVPPGQAGKPAK